jgi:RNA polymerase sigma factor (sigma-70 family)
MNTEGTVTTWIQALSQGDAVAAQRLWERYFARMVDLARSKLRGMAPGAADEEDVALSAFHGFCQAVAQQRFPRLANRDDLWQVLVMLTARKAIDRRKYQHRDKRAGLTTSLLDEVIGPEPDPAFAALVADEFQTLLHRLGEEDLRAIALRKLEGYTNKEIAAQLGCTERTVGRRLSLIRGIWEETTV